MFGCLFGGCSFDGFEDERKRVSSVEEVGYELLLNRVKSLGSEHCCW